MAKRTLDMANTVSYPDDYKKMMMFPPKENEFDPTDDCSYDYAAEHKARRRAAIEAGIDLTHVGGDDEEAEDEEEERFSSCSISAEDDPNESDEEEDEAAVAAYEAEEDKKSDELQAVLELYREPPCFMIYAMTYGLETPDAPTFDALKPGSLAYEVGGWALFETCGVLKCELIRNMDASGWNRGAGCIAAKPDDYVLYTVGNERVDETLPMVAFLKHLKQRQLDLEKEEEEEDEDEEAREPPTKKRRRGSNAFDYTPAKNIYLILARKDAPPPPHTLAHVKVTVVADDCDDADTDFYPVDDQKTLELKDQNTWQLTRAAMTRSLEAAGVLDTSDYFKIIAVDREPPAAADAVHAEDKGRTRPRLRLPTQIDRSVRSDKDIPLVFLGLQDGVPLAISNY